MSGWEEERQKILAEQQAKYDNRKRDTSKYIDNDKPHPGMDMKSLRYLMGYYSGPMKLDHRYYERPDKRYRDERMMDYLMGKTEIVYREVVDAFTLIKSPSIEGTWISGKPRKEHHSWDSQPYVKGKKFAQPNNSVVGKPKRNRSVIKAARKQRRNSMK